MPEHFDVHEAETIAQSTFRFLSSPSAPWLIIILAGTAVTIVYLLKSGMLQFKTSKLEIGRQAAEKEQLIIRRQSDHIQQSVEALYATIPQYEGFEKWKTKFVLEKVIDQMNEWIMFNHLDVSDTYVELKQLSVWNEIQKYVNNEHYKTPEFKEFCDKFVSKMLHDLVTIRKLYNNGGGE